MVELCTFSLTYKCVAEWGRACQPPTTFKVGDRFHIPPKVVHCGNNASTTAPYKVLVFGLFEKGQPDTTPVQ